MMERSLKTALNTDHKQTVFEKAIEPPPDKIMPVWREQFPLEILVELMLLLYAIET